MTETVTALLYLLKDICACAALIMIFRFIFLFEPRQGKVAPVLFALAFIVTAFAGNLILPDLKANFDEITDFASNVLYILLLLFIFKGARIFRTIVTVFLCVCTVDMFYSLFSPVLPAGLMGEYAVNIVFFVIICLLIYFLAAKPAVNFLPKVIDEIPKWVYFVILLFELTCYYKEFGISADWYTVLYTLSSAAVIICFLYFLFKVFFMAYKQNQIIQQLAEQKTYGEKAAKDDEELKRFRHDFKNHMIVVSAMLEAGKSENALKYLAAVSTGSGVTKSTVKTGNFVADAILNSKAANAEKAGAKLLFCGFIPSKGIKDEDLSTVISNLTDNAIEACEKISGEKVIEIDANIMNGFFVFGISNPVDEKTVSRSLKTTKSDTKKHGYGLSNVKRTAEKYNGVLVTDVNEGRFSADVRLKLNDENIRKDENQ